MESKKTVSMSMACKGAPVGQQISCRHTMSYCAAARCSAMARILTTRSRDTPMPIPQQLRVNTEMEGNAL